MDIRIGQGYDVHRLAEGIPFILGGVKLEHTHGLVAHSDGDVLIHSICDAILGAAAMRDIGYHFPDNSDDFKNIDSRILLRKTKDLVSTAGWKIGNIDATICLQRPKVQALIPQMCENMAKDLNIDISAISVKATTNEKIGFVGREEGVAVFAVALLLKD